MPDKPPFMYGFTARHTALSDIVVVVASRDGVAAPQRATRGGERA
jgi:hypothetical protein